MLGTSVVPYTTLYFYTSIHHTWTQVTSDMYIAV